MDSSEKKRFSTVGAVLVLVAVFFVGMKVGASRESAQNDPSPEIENPELYKPEGVDFSAFWRAWNLINEKYVPSHGTSSEEVVTDQEKVWGAIQGLAASLGDPYTVFFPPAQNEIFQSDVRGNFEGVGMEVGVRDGILTVVAPLKGTPAYRAGVKSGDKIIRIEGTSTESLSQDEAISLIRGKKGTPVTLTLFREDVPEPFDVTIVRDTIDIPTINTSLRSDGIFEISLYNFSANSPNLFRGALREFIQANTPYLLLDLRGNPGGYLEAAIDMSSWFLPPGEVIVREDFGDNQEATVYRSRGYDIFNDSLKLVILIDGGSASASEILAGALQNHGVATLVGAKTFGKGSVQELVDITSDTSLKITIARWLTPDGSSISDGGLTPDVEVEITREDLEAGRDPQKDKAIEILLGR